MLTTGSFQLTVDFDPGPGTSNLDIYSGQIGIFVSKLDSAGNFVWARKIGDTDGEEGGTGIAVDAQGNVFATATATW